jgi:hypothetical protein
MARKLTDWNKKVQKQFKAGKATDANYTFKNALQDASKSQSGGNGIVEPAHSNDVVANDLNKPVGAPIGGSGPKHTGGRRSRKNKHPKKKGCKSQKKHKKLKHH